MTTTIAKLKELAMAATPGPWGVSSKENVKKHRVCQINEFGCLAGGIVSTGAQNIRPLERKEEDAIFIAAVNPEQILRMIEAIEIMGEVLERYSNAEVQFFGDRMIDKSEKLSLPAKEALEKVRGLLG